jgi:DNA-binding NarL/FixJ family response regulator
MSQQLIRVLLVDDHALVRAGFRALLDSMTDVEVVAEANNGRDALLLMAQHEPDIVFMDIAMSGLNGLEATAHLTRTHPRSRVIILSMYMTEEYVMQALQAGAVGYLQKDADPAELEKALRTVASGQHYLSAHLSEQDIEGYLQRTAGTANTTNRPTSLTPRQREILQLIAEGHTSREIAQKLNISLKTVETHRANIMERLEIHDLASLVRYAISIGLIH